MPSNPHRRGKAGQRLGHAMGPARYLRIVLERGGDGLENRAGEGDRLIEVKPDGLRWSPEVYSRSSSHAAGPGR